MNRATARRDQSCSELSELRTRLDQMLAEFTSRRHGVSQPAVDIVREDGEMIVMVDVPGARPDEVKIEVSGRELTISGGHDEQPDEQHGQYVLHERRRGSFARSVPLPKGTRAGDIRATSHHGVIEITIPAPVEPATETVTIIPTSV